MEHIEHSYNTFLVALSFLVSVFGSYTGLMLVKVARTAKTNRSAWIGAAAVALGGGAIWTMHFIGMLAYEMGMPVNYDPLLTFVSLVIAVAVVGLGIFFVSANRRSVPRLIVAGIITGLGVASMHYSGMFAMNMAAETSYDPFLSTASVAIAIVATTAALWLAFNLDGTVKMMASAVVMGIAVCGMHYVGMAAMNMSPLEHGVTVEPGMKPLTLGLFIFCFSMLLLVLCLIVTMAQLNRLMYEQLEAEDEDDDTVLQSSMG